MYSVVLMAAMTASAEAPAFGNFWATHCFWEECWPARYGWVACGPGYQPYYPAAYTSCCGCSGYGYSHGCYSSCHGCSGSCHGGCWGSCYGGCSGWWPGSIHYTGCGGGYYSCYGGGPGLWDGIGYAGFGAFGNFGNYGTVPYYGAPVYASPVLQNPPAEATPVQPKPAETKPIEIKPTEVKPKLTAAPAKASVIVHVPTDARIYIDGNLMHSTATERVFTSPAIEAGKPFYYSLRVVVERNGKEVEDVRRVSVSAGEVSRLDFDNLFDRVRPSDRVIVDAKDPARP
jgi:uncharacterized protein (TIGR03000 family)